MAPLTKDGAEEAPSTETDDLTNETEGGVGTDTSAETTVVKEDEEATKELRVSLGIEDYIRLEQHATQRGKSLQGFTRLVLLQAADLLDAGRWESAAHSTSSPYLKAA